jgi:hypothetical protein
VIETRRIKEGKYLVAVGAVDYEFGQCGGVEKIDYMQQIKLGFAIQDQDVKEFQIREVKPASLCGRDLSDVEV